MTVMDRFSLKDRTAVVTGSTRGLGRAFARALAEGGANVVIVGRDAAAAAEVEEELASVGARSLTVLGDVRVRADVERILDRTVDAFGRADVLVNNAGTCLHKAALDVTDEEWREVMSVNVDGLWIASQVFGRHMIEAGGGSIVNVGSMSGAIVNRPQWQPAYNASKAAVHHLTRSLAAEWAPSNVRVNAIAPGYMRTDMAPVDDPRFHRHWIEDTPQQRAGEPDELTIDGGYSVY